MDIPMLNNGSEGNMELYDAVRCVPDCAQKEIGAGRLKGMTDINPMWRIQKLTERFGPCGIGWKYIIRNMHLEPAGNGEIAAFVDIDLLYRTSDGWSEPIPGTGGSSFVSSERSGLHMSDECYKMALTDALSVACKAIGMGADIYWSAGRTKYDGDPRQPESEQKPQQNPKTHVCDRCGQVINGLTKNGEVIKTADEVVAYTLDAFQMPLCFSCMKDLEKTRNGRQ